LNFTGPGGGEWTIDVDDGIVTIEESPASSADLVMTQSPEIFEATAVKAVNPLWAIVSRKVRIRGLRNLGRFAKLIAPPPVTEVIEPI
jgi:putative sterol carrier protein